MNEPFAKLHQHLGRAAALFLWSAAACFGLALVCALLGLPNAVNSFRSVSFALAIAFATAFAAFLIMSMAAAAFRWLDRRGKPVR